MKFVWAYSVFGDNPVYTRGFLRNVEQIAGLRADDLVMVWVPNDSAGDRLVSDAQSIIGAGRICPMHIGRRLPPKFWRHLALDYAPRCSTDGTAILVRDADSRITPREQSAIADWLLSPYNWLILRDHPHHTMAMLAGTYAYRGPSLCVGPKLERWSKSFDGDPAAYGSEPKALESVLWPLAKDDAKVHDTFGSHDEIIRPFPQGADASGPFVGEVVDADDNPRAADRAIWLEAYSRLEREQQPSNRRNS